MCDIQRIKQFKSRLFEKKLIELLKNCGVSRSSVEEIPDKFADRIPEKGINYYYYNGPLDAKTRAFCKLMLKIDKVFSEEEINKISEELGYQVLEYCGSFGCRHQWVKFRGRRINTPKPTVREIRKLINDGVEV